MGNKDNKRDFEKEYEYEKVVENFKKSLLELPAEEQNKYWRELGKPVLNDFEDIVTFDKKEYPNNYQNKLLKWVHYNDNKTEVDFLKESRADHKAKLDRLKNLNDEDVVNYLNKGHIPGLEKEIEIYIDKFKKNKIAHSRIIDWLESKLLVLERNSKTKKIAKNTINGKPLNLQERFIIAEEIFGLKKTLNTLNISQKEKHQLLTFVFDCNIDNARKIFNPGKKYDAKIKNELIDEYINNLKR